MVGRTPIEWSKLIQVLLRVMMQTAARACGCCGCQAHHEVPYEADWGWGPTDTALDFRGLAQSKGVVGGALRRDSRCEHSYAVLMSQ